MTRGKAFFDARNLLFETRDNLDAAVEAFRWPELPEDFQWVTDYFDVIADGNHSLALHLLEQNGHESTRTYDELARRSKQVASFLRQHGARRGDRVLVMLGNETALWETMLAAMRLGAVVIPATTLLSGVDLADRFERGNVRMVVTNPIGAAAIDALDGEMLSQVIKIQVGEGDGWVSFGEASSAEADFTTSERIRTSDPLLEYFTSGTTAKPKLVRHSQVSYPVGHLSTMYWLGLQPNDVHWTISSPGWAKHAWSCFFAPFNAQACVFIFNYERFDSRTVLQTLVDRKVSSLCAPPTVWRFLIQEALSSYAVSLRELISAGEPLNPEVIEQVKKHWGLSIRDGYGQTETTALIGNSPGAELKPGSMGRPLPGYPIALLDADGNLGDEGEISIALGDQRPLALMDSYADDAAHTREVTRNGYYHTGDIARRDEAGYITYVGRADDVFKASGYRISPFELESALVEHPAVAEAAVVPSPDSLRGFVPKAYVITTADHEPSRETARDIFTFLRQRIPGFKLVRRLEFAELPKTISGKIRRVELRGQEQDRSGDEPRCTSEFLERDLRS